MPAYETTRRLYRPKHIKVLLVAESPPPDAMVASSRHFYRTDQRRSDDRLFANTMQALYPDAALLLAAELEQHKAEWLRRFQMDGWYMIEALEISQEHAVAKQQRQDRIREALPRLVERIQALAEPETKLILIKSNVFEVAAAPLRNAGFTVLNTTLVDYPGRYNQRAYREKLSALARQAR